MLQLANSHVRFDARSLALHRRVAEKLEAEPELLAIARENLRRWQATESPPSSIWTEWQRILDAPLDAVLRLLTERSERAAQLRQSSPFPGILSDIERQDIYESYATRAYHPGGKPDIG
jgi:hypothetical protein